MHGCYVNVQGLLGISGADPPWLDFTIDHGQKEPSLRNRPPPAAIALGADFSGRCCAVLVLVSVLVDLVGQVVNDASAEFATPVGTLRVVAEAVTVSLHTDMGAIAGWKEK